MSLRKSTCLTPERIEAARRNSQRSTGPRSEAGKRRMKLNALKHGGDAAPENEAAVMRALGEDPERFAALKRDLASGYGAGDGLFERQIEDLARLYWRRDRIERMETGLMRDALEGIEERRRQLPRALADVTFDASQCDAVALGLPEPTHPCVRLRMLISLWGVIREQAGRRAFTGEQRTRIEPYYREALGWRPRQIGYLLGLFLNWAYFRAKPDQAGLDEYVENKFGGEAEVEARYQELVRLLDEQIAEEEAAFAQELAAEERQYAIERDSCLAPEGKTREMLLRQEMALDRAIDRKVKIILTLRKEHAQRQREAAGPPGDQLLEAGADTPSSVCDSGQVGEARPSLRETQTPNRRGLRHPEESAEDGAGETTKSAEQSENVIENKGLAAVGVCR